MTTLSITIALLLAAAPEPFYNLVDWWYYTFGQESFDVLFDIADAVYNFLLFTMGSDYKPLLDRVWEVLFT